MPISIQQNVCNFLGALSCLVLYVFFAYASRLCFRPATLLKKRLWHWCFLVNFAKFSRAPFLQNTSGRLILTLILSGLNLKIFYISISCFICVLTLQTCICINFLFQLIIRWCPRGGGGGI